MRIDYKKILKDNIRKYGEDTDHLAVLCRLYTDKTHFLFELLQNAEDAGATRILFSLFADRLEVVHDGRVFNEEDVRGICSIAKGTKIDDLTKIGKHGIGFKSVFAYTASPEVHSGGEGFRIKNYVRPYAVTYNPPCNLWTTRFVFPFDAEDKRPEIACAEIGTRLRNLNARTLLFLHNLNEIEYKLLDSADGVYKRQEIKRGIAREINLIGQSANKEEEETWLIFERSVPIPEKSKFVRVEAGFRLKKDKDGKNPERIVKFKDSPLVVYFPTEKDTKLGFLIQGPYRTTPSRDNIPKDDEWNKTLVTETAKLIEGILPEIKNLGLLSISFLEALPIKTNEFPDDSMFYPIVESVRNVLMSEELLPADDGSFISARNAKLANGAKLRELLNQSQLGQLFQSTSTIKWLTGEITVDRTPDLRVYLLNELKVEEIAPDDFARKITNSFLSCQSDEWFIDFYGYLLNHETLWRAKSDYGFTEGPLRKKPIIRCQDGQQRVPFDNLGNPIVFLPVRSKIAYPVVCKSIYENTKAAKFLDLLGLVAPDICIQVLNDIIPLYERDVKIEDSIHRDHISMIAEAMELEDSPHYNRLISVLKDTTWVLATNAKTGELFYDAPKNLFFQLPELLIFFEKNANIWFLAEVEKKIDWKKLGVRTKPIINCRGLNPGYNGYVFLKWSRGYHKRGIDGFDPETNIDELEHALMHITVSKSIYIWNELLPPLIRFLHGRYEVASHQTYDNAKPYDSDSKLCEMLKNYAWLPVIDGEFKKPSDCTIADLIGELKRNQQLADILGLQRLPNNMDVEKEQYAAKLGVSLDNIEFMKNNHEAFQQWKSAMISCKERPVFPARPVVNPERRQEHLLDNFSVAPYKEYKKRERNVRTTRNTIDPATWLREQYTNETGQMVCQICKNEMPFKKRNGEYYFEEKEILSKKYLPKEYEAQHLALCPLCAAKYEEFVKNDDDVMSTLKKNIIMAENDEIPLSLGDGDEEASIRFVESHLQDLKLILGDME